MSGFSVIGHSKRSIVTLAAAMMIATGPLPASAQATCPSLLNTTLTKLQDETPVNLCQFAGKTLLIVNTASYCGFTDQYKDLETLYQRYKDRGLVVLGFPSNDFSQEPGSNQTVAEFCSTPTQSSFPCSPKAMSRELGPTPFLNNSHNKPKRLVGIFTNTSSAQMDDSSEVTPAWSAPCLERSDPISRHSSTSRQNLPPRKVEHERT